MAAGSAAPITPQFGRDVYFTFYCKKVARKWNRKQRTGFEARAEGMSGGSFFK
jgi:hypothetical protein